jgi:NitT/TauT family transport system substrate-binding protein
VPAELVKLEPSDLHLPRLRYNHPEPYSAEEFRRTYDFMRSWGLIDAQSTYDRLVDARVAV